MTTFTCSLPFGCVTHRQLYQVPLLEQVEGILAQRPAALLLREKDLNPEVYRQLARQVLSLCRRAGVPCILHFYPEAARELRPEGLHLPLPVLERLRPEERAALPPLGASCHSLKDVLTAAKLGAARVTLGHIYTTACKPNLAPRGVTLLQEVCRRSPVPVWAIGGVTREKLPELAAAGAAGAWGMGAFAQLPEN